MLSARLTLNLTWLAAGIAAALVLAACGGGSDGAQMPAAGDVSVTLKEWSLTADPGSVAAGSVTFAATNDGSLQHELVVLKTDLAAGALPVSGGSVDEAAAGDVIGEVPAFSAGATESLTLELEPGAYVLFCNIGGHYQQGVRSAFTVTADTTTGDRYY
jgi:uncharacterized cupredoxin-like copper-binding protein